MKNTTEFELVIDRSCGLDSHHDAVVATIKGNGI